MHWKFSKQIKTRYKGIIYCICGMLEHHPGKHYPSWGLFESGKQLLEEHNLAESHPRNMKLDDEPCSQRSSRSRCLVFPFSNGSTLLEKSQAQHIKQGVPLSTMVRKWLQNKWKSWENFKNHYEHQQALNQETQRNK